MVARCTGIDMTVQRELSYAQNGSERVAPLGESKGDSECNNQIQNSSAIEKVAGCSTRSCIALEKSFR